MDNRGCKNCIGYLVPTAQQKTEKCYKCHCNAAKWIQNPYGTFGVKCTNCGVEVVADLNTECEMDQTKYVITISFQELPSDKLMKFCKIIGENGLNTKQKLRANDVLLEGNLSYAWSIMRELNNIGIEYSIKPDDIEKRYFYANICKYPYSSFKH